MKLYALAAWTFQSQQQQLLKLYLPNMKFLQLKQKTTSKLNLPIIWLRLKILGCALLKNNHHRYRFNYDD